MGRSQKRQGAGGPAPRVKQTAGNSEVIAYRKQRYTFTTSVGAWNIVNQHLPNPDRVLQKRGQSVQLYRELLSDAHLAATLESRESSTLAYDWRIERGDCPKRIYAAIEKWFFSIIERKMAVEDLSRDEDTDTGKPFAIVIDGVALVEAGEALDVVLRAYAGVAL